MGGSHLELEAAKKLCQEHEEGQSGKMGMCIGDFLKDSQ